MRPVDDQPAELRALADQAVAAGDVAIAIQLIDKVWRRHPGPSTAAYVNGRLAKLERADGKPVSVAILRSFTVEPLVPILRAAACLNGIELTVQVGAFNNYAQELLDPQSPLYVEWQPDVAVLAVQTRDIAPELWGRFADLSPEDVRSAHDRVISEYRSMIATFRRLSLANLVVHGLERPPHLAMGLADTRLSPGQADVLSSINRELAAIASETEGVYVLDYDAVVARAGRRSWYDEDKWASVRLPMTAEHLVDLPMEWLRFIQPLVGRVAKVLVVDLDNTLWGGVVGEDGLEGLRLSPEGIGAGYWALQRAVRSLKSRGIVLAVCSKNNEADARNVFDSHPDCLLKWNDFACTRVNWENKADNLRSIAAELNVGLDSVAFLDDNAAECVLIRQQLPEVIVLELDQEPTVHVNPVLGSPFFERLELAQEDQDRTRYYEEQRERSSAASSATSLEDYLRSLETRVSIRRMDPADVARVAQLTQKTNQFNVTTRRYNEPEIKSLDTTPGCEIIVARAADRFGDHGLIAVIIVRGRDTDTWTIDTFLMSCRVIGRGIETAMLAALVGRAAEAGAKVVEGLVIPTAKNTPVRDVYGANGFALIDSAGDETRWRFDVTLERLATPDWIHVDRLAEQPTHG